MTVCAVVDLQPACLNLSGIRAGDANAIPMYLHHGDTPVDLTDQILTAQARKKSTSDEYLAGVIVIDDDPTTGRFTLSWPGEDVRTWLAGKDTVTGVWDLQLGPDGAADTQVAGTFEANMDVTRAGIG